MIDLVTSGETSLKADNYHHENLHGGLENDLAETLLLPRKIELMIGNMVPRGHACVMDRLLKSHLKWTGLYPQYQVTD